jgi:hypothetical protein
MRSPAGDQLLVARTAEHAYTGTLRAGVVQVAFGLISLILSLALHARSEPAPVTTITVLVYNYVHVSRATLAVAEREANKILGAAGAQVAWIECLDQPLTLDAKHLCLKGWTAQIPGLRFISSSNKFQEAEFASTAIPVLSTIYYDKIARRAHRDNADAGLPVFLGCIMAHELGHILLSDPVHSATGIMQPQWGHPQIHQALTGNLLFTRQQATRIQAQARFIASLRPTFDPALPSSTP